MVWPARLPGMADEGAIDSGPLFSRGVGPRARAVREVYAVQAVTLGLVKIGVADDAVKRLRELRNFSPDRLNLLGLAKCSRFGLLERELHQRFAAQRRHGEWFEPTDEMLWYIQDTMDWNTRRVRVCQRELDQPDAERRLKRYRRREEHLRRWA